MSERQGPPTVQAWPGQRLGLPERGPGSVARPGARLAAFAVDALLCDLVALGLRQTGTGASWSVGTLATAVFLVEVLVLGVLGGASAGQRVLGMRLAGAGQGSGRPLGVLRPVVRTLLLALLVPVLVWDRDQRGLHDRAAQTVLVRTR